MEESPRLYVGNLPYIAQKRDIEALFEHQRIPIKNIDISIDPFTGRNPSYCFIDFDDHDTAQLVLNSMQGHHVRGRPIKINLKTERNPAQQQVNPSVANKISNPNGRTKTAPQPPAEPENPHVFDRWDRYDAQTHWTAPAQEGRRLYVGGMPRIPQHHTLELEMKALFKDFKLLAVSKLMSPHHSKQGPGHPAGHACYVDLETSREANLAAKLLDGKPTPHGETYKVLLAQHSRGVGIVVREQLTGTSKIFLGFFPRFFRPAELQAEVYELLQGFSIKHVTKPVAVHPVKQTADKKGRHFYCFVEMENGIQAQAAVAALNGTSWPDGSVRKVRLARAESSNFDELMGWHAKVKTRTLEPGQPRRNRDDLLQRESWR
ncbi:ribonucleoprotein [Cercospora zeina]